MPEQIKDYLALVGDASDNVPGVPGIGEKTAQRILREFGTIENALKFKQRLPEKVRSALEEHYEELELSRKLVELDSNVELQIELDELIYKGYEKQRLLEVLKKFEFSSIIKELQLTTDLTKEAKYSWVSDGTELKKLLERIEQTKKITLDLETTSLDPYTGSIVGISIAVDEGEAYYIPVGHKSSKTLTIQRLKSF